LPNHCETAQVIVRLAGEQDVPGFINLAGQVEHWFGPMVGDPGFRAAVGKHIIPGSGIVEVVTFGIDHPGADASGARVFYERHGKLIAAPPRRRRASTFGELQSRNGV
jgi:hypothetical protein